MDNQNYVKLSLELHLFFARIMKEHAIFLIAGFSQANPDFAKETAVFKEEFETLLDDVTNMSQGLISSEVLNSGEIVTDYTFNTESKTQYLTCINIDQNITKKQLQLCTQQQVCINENIVSLVQQINTKAIQLLEQFILLKETILQYVQSCQMFTMNYPLLLEHILREAKLYHQYVMNYESGIDFNNQDMKQVEQFWNQIMMEHALFIRGLLDPSENELIQTSNQFVKDYQELLNESYQKNHLIMDQTLKKSYEETEKLKEFKTAGTKGILNCEIQSIILPLLADHVLREADHYLRLLES